MPNDYKITTGFFAQSRPDIKVPCIRAEYPDGTFIRLSHNAPIAFPLPFFTVLMNDDKQMYYLLYENGYRPTRKICLSDGKLYEIWGNFQDIDDRRLLGHNKAFYSSSAFVTQLYVDNRKVLVIFRNGNIWLSYCLTSHARNCIKTFCKLFGNDMTYDLLMSLHKKGVHLFNIIDILRDKGGK